MNKELWIKSVILRSETTKDLLRMQDYSQTILKQVERFFGLTVSEWHCSPYLYDRKQYYVYILTNKSNTLYIGITNDLIRRLYEHKNKLIAGFTKKYNIDRLIYYEVFDSPETAIQREKEIKSWTRKKKLELIKKINPNFEELEI